MMLGYFTRILIHQDELEALEVAASCLPEDSLIVEIGSFEGASTIALATGARRSRSRVVSVDWGQGTPGEQIWDPEDDYTVRYTENLNLFRVDDLVYTVREDSRKVAASWDCPIHLLFVDGDHCYENVKADLVGFAPFLVSGAVVAVHDYCLGFPGVMRAVNEVFPDSLDTKKQVNSLRVFRFWRDRRQ